MKSGQYVRSFIFGVEDSLVSTVGLISGVAAANLPKENIILTGVILVFVEAFSMGVGELLSENSEKEYETRSSVALSKSSLLGFVMFISYFISGLLVIFPYLFVETFLAMKYSIAISLGALFILGIISAKLSGTSIIKKGFTMMIVGGLAVALGIVVAMLIS